MRYFSEGIIQGDCLAGMRRMRPRSVDFAFIDLPYGQTANDWDREIPLDIFWDELRRVLAPSAVSVFTGIQPFTSKLVMSNLEWFRFGMVWRKNNASGYLSAKKRPMRAHEDLLIFARRTPTYRPIMTEGHRPRSAWKRSAKCVTQSTNYGNGGARETEGNGGTTMRYPTTVLDIDIVKRVVPYKRHPTEKPEALVSWFLRTYTEPGALVFDPTAGSGSTLLAAKKLGRRYLGFELDPEMVTQARRRLAEVELSE